MNPSDKYEQIKDIKHLNPVEQEAMVLKHEQQIKDIAAHLMEFKREDDDLNNVRYKANYRYETKKWVGLTGTEVNHIFAANVGYPERMMKEVEAKLKEKNGG